MKKFIGLALLNVYLNYQRAGYSLDSAYIECGGAAFPKGVVTVAHVTYLFIQIVVPIMLNDKCTPATFFALRLTPMLERTAVTQVPMF